MERLHNQENPTRKRTATAAQTIIVNSDEEALATLQCKGHDITTAGFLLMIVIVMCVCVCVCSPADTSDHHSRKVTGFGTGTHHCSSRTGSVRPGTSCYVISDLLLTLFTIFNFFFILAKYIWVFLSGGGNIHSTDHHY